MRTFSDLVEISLSVLIFVHELLQLTKEENRMRLVVVLATISRTLFSQTANAKKHKNSANILLTASLIARSARLN